MTAQHISVTEAAELFRTHAHRIGVIAHVNPDGDAIGSGTAVVHMAHEMGRQAWLSFARPTELAANLRDIPGAKDVIRPEDMPDDLDFVVVVDCGSADRMGALAQLADQVPYTLVLDHHRSNDGFGTHSVIRPTDDAAAQIVLDLIDALEVPLTSDMAESLYSAVVTDTGCFRWGSSRSHRDAARLLDYGLDSRAIIRRLMDSKPYSYLEFLARTLRETTYSQEACAGRGVVYAVVPYPEFQRCSLEDVQSFIDILRSTEEAEVAMTLRETEPQVWTGSLRSHTDVNVAEVASQLGGGGHRRAAGFTLSGTLDEVKARVFSVLADPPLYQEPAEDTA